MRRRFFGKQYFRYQLSVSEVFKGKTARNTVEILIPNNSCRIKLSIGKEYIIYGNKDKLSESVLKGIKQNQSGFVDNVIWTNYCTRTELFKAKEVKKLRRLKKKLISINKI